MFSSSLVSLLPMSVTTRLGLFFVRKPEFTYEVEFCFFKISDILIEWSNLTAAATIGIFYSGCFCISFKLVADFYPLKVGAFPPNRKVLFRCGPLPGVGVSYSYLYSYRSFWGELIRKLGRGVPGSSILKFEGRALTPVCFLYSVRMYLRTELCL
jgi:hypothetical protein